MLRILTNTLVILLLGTIALASEPYCVRNESIITRTPVTKTRQIIKKPTGFFKAFKKTKVYVEKYEDFEEHIQIRYVRSCCDGFKMSRFDICEPICDSGCPTNANCIEPNRCQCQRGYISAISSKNGTHYCEPICNGGCPVNARCAQPDVCECERGYHIVDYQCEPRCASGCPFGGTCIRPEQCDCLEGYNAEAGTCIPICTAGDGCLNGRCLGKETCICNKGFQMNTELQICEKSCKDGICEENYDDESEFNMSTTESFDGEQTTDDSIELDEGEKIFLTPPSDYTDYPNLSDKTIHNQKCPDNYIFYEYQCRPKVFASNEVHCNFKPCAEHAVCQSNGTCTCLEGYSWYKQEKDAEPTTVEKDTAVCLTFAEINKLLKESRLIEIDPEDDTDWFWSGCFIGLGILCMMGALFFLTMKLLRHRNGKMDVEVKNDLYCTYDNKNSRDVPHVL